jgi:hypothetical protein
MWEMVELDPHRKGADPQLKPIPVPYLLQLLGTGTGTLILTMRDRFYIKKRHAREIFDLWVFSLNNTLGYPNAWAKAVSNIPV